MVGLKNDFFYKSHIFIENMKALYTEIDFKNSKPSDLLPLECNFCMKTFNRSKHQIQRFINQKQHSNGDYCSISCSVSYHNGLQPLEVVCKNCNSTFKKLYSEIKKTKNNFCRQSCAATYSNKHKSTGIRRSKLEMWLEQQLPILYPNIEFHFNRKNTIGSELDIYIPSLNIAFELNGIFHYEPIYGVDKLTQIQSNDISKSKACHDAKIDLCIIDTSSQKYVKPSTSQKYLEIINDIIKERIISTKCDPDRI